MSYVCVGDAVRIYYEDHFFDEGEVTVVCHDGISVDFYDWIEQWQDDSVFALVELFYEGIAVLVPIHRGIIVIDYRP